MSKKKNTAKGAVNNAAPAASSAQPAVNTDKTVTNESKKAEETQQVAAPAVTKEAEKKDPPKQKPVEKQPKPKKDKTPTVIAEEVSAEDAMVNLAKTVGTSASSSGVSVDAAAMLAYVGHQRFTNNEELKKTSPEFYDVCNQSINAVWFLGMLGVQQEMIRMQSEGKLRLLVSPEQIMPMQEMAKMFGVELAPAKALPDLKDGQLAIDFTPGGETKVPLALQDAIPLKDDPELDPKKVGKDPEKIKEALEFLIRKDRNIAISLVNTIEWYRVLCMENAESADKKLELDNRSVSEWMEEIFTIAPPKGILTGLGRSVYLYTKTQSSPVSAHCLLHGQLKDLWSEEQIASALKVLLRENFRYNLEGAHGPDGNGKPTVEKPEDDKAIQATIGALGNSYVDKLFEDYDLEIGPDDKDKNEKECRKKEARKIISLVRANYFPGKIEPTREHYRFAVGKIINWYRSPMDRLAEYEGEIPVLTGEYPPKEAEKTAPVVDEKKK